MASISKGISKETKKKSLRDLGKRVAAHSGNNGFSWTILPHLISYKPAQATIKRSVACFDLDLTLIVTKTGRRFASGSSDWKWFNEKVVEKLQSTASDHTLVIFSNQGGVVAHDKTAKSLVTFKAKIELIFTELNSLGISDIILYACPKMPAALKKDPKYNSSSEENPFVQNRKPNVGMWEALKKDFSMDSFEKCFFVGDAAGRKGDFSDSDKKFAENAGLRFLTPEEFFV